MSLFVIYLHAAHGIYGMTVRVRDVRPGDSWAWLRVWGAALILPVLVPLASRLRGPLDHAVALALLVTPNVARDLWNSSSWNGAQGWVVTVLGGLLALFAASVVVAGVQQHLALRRLGRRLDALRERGLAASAGEAP